MSKRIAVLLILMMAFPAFGNDELLRALEIKDEEKAIRFLKKPPTPLNINIQNEAGMTPLMLAFKNEFYDAIPLILKKRPNLKLINNDKEGALIFAARMGDSELLESLLKHNPPLNQQNRFGRTALMYAAMEGFEDSALLILEKGASVKFLDGKNMNALHYAVIGNSNLLVAGLFKKAAKKDLGTNVLNRQHGQSPLALAAKKGDREMIEVLLQNGALINQKTSTLKTPLFYGLINKNRDAVEVLLEKGALVDLVDSSANSPLHYAAQTDNQENLKDILKFLAGKINQKNGDKMVPIILAAEKGLSKNIELLLDVSEVNVNLSNKKGLSLLYLLVLAEDYENTKLLFSQKKFSSLYINPRDENGKSALLILAQNEATEVCRLFLSRSNIDVSGRDEAGNTLGHLFSMLEETDLLTSYLKRVSFDPNVQNKNGKTPLMLALKTSNQKAVSILKEFRGTKFELVDNFGRGLLHAALKNGEQENVDWAISQVSKYDPSLINKKDKQEKTPLMSAAISSNPETFEKLANLPGIKLDLDDKEGMTALLIAIKNKNFELAKILLMVGADPNAGSPEDFNPYSVEELFSDEEVMGKMVQNTGKNINYAFVDALEAEVSNKVVATFFQYGALANYRIVKGHRKSWTTLHLAANYGDPEVIKLFIERPEFELNTVTSNGATALIIAAMRGQFSAVEELVKAGADPNRKMKKLEKATALHYAALAGDKNPRTSGEDENYWKIRYGKTVVELLKAPNIKVNVLDEDGNAALFNACLSGNFDGVKALLERNSIVDEENNIGVTPMMVAVTHGDKSLIEELLKHEASFKGESDFGWSVFNYAIRKFPEREFIEFLLEKGLPKSQADRALRDSKLLESEIQEIKDWIN
ncbi:MAG: hypothetical protein HOM21_04045 [Halobacteriovoraceae bacterium]|nr:hypothetical protein [Halobacteriovoraceae bacterium]